MSGQGPRVSGSQTLDRGLQVLKVLAATPYGATVGELATQLGVHRTVVYRLVTTLVAHRLVRRGRDGRLLPGTGLLDLARAVVPNLQAVAVPELSALAEAVKATAFVAVADGDEAVGLLAIEPRSTAIHVAYRAGFRHPIERGADGLAILAGRPPVPGERPEVALARQRGYAWSRGEVQAGAVGVAAPVRAGDRRVEASVGVVTLGEGGVETAVPLVMATASRIGAALG